MDQKELETMKRLGQVETEVKIIRHDIETIKDNHLAHMKKDIDKIDMRLWAILIILVGSTLIPVIKSFL
jgi:hypothetical protein